MEFLTQQLYTLTRLDKPIIDIIIAYEPIWAIGTGLTPKLEEISEIMNLIRGVMNKNLPNVKASLLYGGSVTSKNASEILNISGVNGVLVGGASLKVDEFSKICEYAVF